MIQKRGNKWVLKFSDGREEEFDSKEAAEKRERQINYFKHTKDKVRKKK